jgi:hypothetical protein
MQPEILANHSLAHYLCIAVSLPERTVASMDCPLKMSRTAFAALIVKVLSLQGPVNPVPTEQLSAGAEEQVVATIVPAALATPDRSPRHCKDSLFKNGLGRKAKWGDLGGTWTSGGTRSVLEQFLVWCNGGPVHNGLLDWAVIW